MKYKLLKNYPPYKKGDILQKIGISGYAEDAWAWNVTFSIVENTPKWFAPYVFTTEDKVEVFVNDIYYWITETEVINHTNAYIGCGANKLQTYFSTREAAIQYQIGSDLDVDKTCKTCKHYLKVGICLNCLKSTTIKKDLWQPKELQFEVDKWYEHKDGALALFKELEEKNPGFDHVKESISYIWSYYIYMSIPNQWKLADMDKVRTKLLDEAKKRFPVGSRILDLINVEGTIDDKPFRFGVFLNTTHDIYSNKGHYCLYEEGKWAEIVKAPKLMLGDVEVFVVKKGDIHPSKRYCDKKMVWTEKGAVTTEEWLEWWKIVNSIIKENNIKYFNLRLGSYLTTLQTDTEKFNRIGCLEMVSWEQLEKVTKAIKNEN